MIGHLAVGAAVAVLCLVVGGGFYIGVRHVEEMSQLSRRRERPDWAQESVDTYNRIVGRPVSPAFVEDRSTDDDGREEDE